MPSLSASCQQNLLLHQLLAHLLLKEVENHRVVGVLRAALLQLLAGNLAPPSLADRVSRGQKRLYQWG
jgi:hypothetical protein